MKKESNNSVDSFYILESFKNFFSELEMRSQVIHEISHWLRDTFSNKHLFSDLEKGIKPLSIELDAVVQFLNNSKKKDKDWKEKERRYIELNKAIENILNVGEEHRNLSHYEIDAQIHELINLKKGMKEEDWDKLSFEDLFVHLTHFTYLSSVLIKDKKIYARWKHLLFLRMLREDILPEYIKNTFRESINRKIEKIRDTNKYRNEIIIEEYLNHDKYVLEDILIYSEIKEAKKENRNAI